MESTTVQQSIEIKEQQSTDPEKTKSLIKLSKKFAGLLDLMGNIDHLPGQTKEHIRSLIMLRNNIDILT